MNSADASLEELNHWMLAHHMRGFWMQGGAGPGPQRPAHLWKWADFSSELLKPNPLVPAGTADRTEIRTIALRNPKDRGIPTTVSLNAQILMPGERTPTHRNLQNDCRFVIQASPGAVSLLEGEPFPISAGDLVVIPGGTAHDHRNGGAEPAIWLESLDVALLAFVGVEIDERDPVDHQDQIEDKPAGYFSATHDRMKDPRVDGVLPRPPINYPWSDTFATLTAIKESEVGGDLLDGIHLRYTSPVDRGPTFPTFSGEILLLRPRLQARAHRRRH